MLDEFLAPFPADAAQRIRRAANETPGIIVVHADAPTRQFRLDPAAALAAVETQMRALTRDRVPERIVWCYTGDLVNGLEAFELSAVLGRHLEIESIAQAETADERRFVVIGWPRVHLPLMAINADALDATAVGSLLAESTKDGWPGVLVLLGLERLKVMTGGLREQFVAFVNGGGEAGLFVAQRDTDRALGDPSPYADAIRGLGIPVRFVQFERGLSLTTMALTEFMRATGVRCDISLPVDSGSAAEGGTSRPAAFAGPSPYFPQPFDLRAPSYSPERRPFIELPMVALQGPDAIGNWWRQATWPDDKTLAERLDGPRMAEFFRASRVNPALEREYPSFRIYNWPRPSPRRRVWLLDAGRTPGVLSQLKRDLLTLRDREGAVIDLPRAADAIELAEREAHARYTLSATGAIDVQNVAHSYLTDVPRDAPLRNDYAEFVRFVSPGLGRALEIGSGYGVLAWALSPRATGYVCLDLDRAMFRALRTDLGQSGVVGDAHQLPFADASFDSLVANNVIEHFYDPLLGLREIRRVLRPGGRLFALLPFDALNSRHELPAHLWKLDLDGLTRALAAADLSIGRIDVIDLHAMGVPGAFPSCYGRAAMVEAWRPSTDAAGESVVRVLDVASPYAASGGRLWPSIRELVRFESWRGRRIITVGAPADDVDEFRRFGADVTAVPADMPWAAGDRGFDFAYVYLPAAAGDLARLAAETRSVLEPGGRAVVVFRNWNSLRVWSRMRSYFGDACDLLDLAGPQHLIAAVEADRAQATEYVEPGDVERAFAAFSDARMRISNLLPEDLAAGEVAAYAPGFWAWMSETFGRFVVVAVAP